MQRKTIRLLIFCFAVLFCFFISSCDDIKDQSFDNDRDENSDNGSLSEGDTVIDIPASSDLGRDVINFSEITYTRPDTAALTSSISEVTATINNNDKSYDDQLAAISALEQDYSRFLTMYAYANVAISRNAADAAAVLEYEYLSSAYPKIIQAVEDMMVAAANSPHAENFENDYFGEGLIEKYADGGSYTDALVLLLEEEAELEAEFTSLSTSNVTITYGGITDTFDNIEKALREKHGYGTLSYNAEIKICQSLYDSAVSEVSCDILVELLKVRKLIADECGYESYADYAYTQIYHDYNPEEIEDFFDDISAYTLPIYRTLANQVFYDYFRTHAPRKLNYAHVVNSLGKLYSEIDTDLSDVYSYMLHYGYFDIEKAADNRTDGAFTVYFEEYDTPFIFMTSVGDCSDYMTLSHEFGHFYDSFANYDAPASMDLLEVSSQGLELLTLSKLKGAISDDEYKYLYYQEMQNALLTLIFQGFYAKFEHKAYELEYSEITKERLSAVVADTAREMGLNSEHYNDLSSVVIPHVVLYPFYVQSYCTSIISALDIFFLEEDSENSGITVYKALLERDDGDSTFIKQLSDVGLESPLSNDKVKETVDKIHFYIMGYHYYSIQPGGSNAA